MKLWKHQEIAIERMKRSGESGYALFMEAGTGKSACVVEYIKSFIETPKTLIFCPLVVCQNWESEFIKFFGGNIEKDILVLNGSSEKKKEILSKNKKNIVITNYETLIQKEVVDSLVKWCPEILVCDESHRIKSPDSKRSQEILKLSNIAKKRFILTGTPVLKNELDLFHQFRVMDGTRGHTFSDKNFYTFRARYFYNRNASRSVTFPDWKIKENSAKEIAQIIANKSFSVLKKDCLDLPELVKKSVFVEMGSDQKRAYDSMYKDFMSIVENSNGEMSVAVAELAITKGMRLQQIVSGFVNNEQGIAIHFSKNPKLDALEELLEDISGKVIIWASFKENYKMISQMLDKLHRPYVMLTGQQNIEQKNESIAKFKSNVDIIIANQGAGGIGINLTEASTAIYYSRDFSLEKDIQSEARNYRGGSEVHDKITRIDLVTRKTIDEEVVSALHNKQQVLDFILQGVRK